ncbi:MAG TPA: DUF3857 domain-containing protein [Terriglobales bacterium]|nr:DUF3857 domain-containing protein [Terriglobales bacterium]
MPRPLSLLLLALFSVAPTAVNSQSSPAKSVETADHSKEAVIHEQFKRTEKFENDGTEVRQDSSRIRIQSEAGVQRYGVLSFSYASGTGSLDIKYVRVRKPDGTVIETPPDSVQDMAAEITRQAPFYSDLHEKHVAVKGLGAGDILEYQIEEHTTKPLAPGQFWTSYVFTHNQIVLDEELEISVPRDRAIKFKSEKVQPQISEAAGYRVYTWHSKNLENVDESKQKREATEEAWQQARGRQTRPDVELSSFSSWSEVGRWYDDLQKTRVKPTEEVAAKAAELTKGAATDDEKLKILYSYVSTQFHYIGVAFGIGRYQPHAAESVLENQYGDCKDKHTLLASLLTAAGIPAYPVLISSAYEVDADVPSPGQFNHVITVVPRGSELIWLDTTAEVGPYRYLVPPLRDKHALAIWKDKAELVLTPKELSAGSFQKFNMDGKLSDTGVFEGHVEVSARGDAEYSLRSAFRMVAVQQWKELGQRISAGMGFGGEVSEVIVSSPEKMDEPFHYSYKYTRKDYGDWSNHRTFAPNPFILLPGPGEEEELPLGPTWIGVPEDLEFESAMELPQGYRPLVPAAIHWKRDFAEYDATYEFKDHKLITKRHLKTLMEAAPAGEREAYKELVKVMQDDYGQFIPFISGPESEVAASGVAAVPPTIAAIRNLPDSSSQDATRLEKDAQEAIRKNDVHGAVSSLYRAVQADPKFARGWVMLGQALFLTKEYEAAIDAFHKAMAAKPDEPAIQRVLGFALMASRQFEDAISVWKDYLKAHPSDLDGEMNLASSFIQVRMYAEAAEAYEAAAKLGEDQPRIQMALGSTYLRAGNKEKAVDAFTKLGELDVKNHEYFNSAAYYMANADLNLPLALTYAKKAVRKAEEESQKTTLDALSVRDLGEVATISAYWDTIGWVYERMTKLEVAEPYLRGAWDLTQDGVVAGHLCHLYRRDHKTASAIQMCRLAVYRLPLATNLTPEEFQEEMGAAQENLSFLAGKSEAQAKDTTQASDMTTRERTFKLPHFLPGNESAEFWVLLSSDGKSKTFKVEDVKFVSGSDKMKLQGKQLKTIDFKVPAPDDVPTRFVRRGILGCYQYSGCSFVLLDPGTVKSVN